MCGVNEVSPFLLQHQNCPNNLTGQHVANVVEPCCQGNVDSSRWNKYNKPISLRGENKTSVRTEVVGGRCG